MKIRTPRHIAILSAVLVATIFGIISLSIVLIGDVGVRLFWIPLFSFIVGLVVYFLLLFLIEKFIYRKIKLIYKSISKQKSPLIDKKLNIDTDVLEEVNKEVANWVDNKNLELDKLKEQEAFRREFLGNLAHEIKTPIFSVQGYILTLLEGGLEDENVNRLFLEKASKGVDRITHIIDDLDEISKFESNSFQLNIKKNDLKDLSCEIIDSMNYKIEKKDIEIELKSYSDHEVFVEMDRGRVGQVLTNLINNAISYSKDEEGKIEVRLFDMDSQVLVEVADNGIGISEEHLNRICERFYRVDKSRARHQGGSGLGLAIVKHIVEAHNQRINVRSTIDVGTTFSFTLEKAK